MKGKTIICDVCKKEIEATSPPSKESYKQGWIEVRDMSILLGKPKNQVHATILRDKDFCCLSCLIRYLQRIRKW